MEFLRPIPSPEFPLRLKGAHVMNKSISALLAGAMVFALGSSVAMAADQKQERDQTRDQSREKVIYGYQLMTAQEREQYQAQMRNAKTAEERERLRKEHHEKMQARAKQRGVMLPDMPPRRRSNG